MSILCSVQGDLDIEEDVIAIRLTESLSNNGETICSATTEMELKY